jgi:hypothetical protein
MPFDGRILSGVSVLGAVVEGGSFAKAAELIGITDSGVSRAISRLETRLGVRLLNRTTRSVTLTEEGRRFYEEVSPHLSAIEDAAVVASLSCYSADWENHVDLRGLAGGGRRPAKVSGRKFPFPKLLFAKCPPRRISNCPWGLEP